MTEVSKVLYSASVSPRSQMMWDECKRVSESGGTFNVRHEYTDNWYEIFTITYPRGEAMSEHYGDALDGALRTIAQQSAVIEQQNETIDSQWGMLQRGGYDELLAQIKDQSELIEKLADVLKCVDGGHTEPGWLGEIGKIEMWRVDEAVSSYNEWKENK